MKSPKGGCLTIHGTNEYPFLIDSEGISILPVMSLTLEHKVSNERISSGIPALDQMLGGEGFLRGSSVLVSGTANDERNRGLYVMKSRGMKHSNQVREFIISDEGLDLVDVFLGPDGVLTGSAREAQQLLERTGIVLWDHAISRKDREIERKEKVLESKIAGLKEEFDSVREELNKAYIEEELKKEVLEKNRKQMERKRDSRK